MTRTNPRARVRQKAQRLRTRRRKTRADGLPTASRRCWSDGVVLVVEQAQTVLALEEARETSVEVETLGIGVASRAEAAMTIGATPWPRRTARSKTSVAGSVPGRGRGRKKTTTVAPPSTAARRDSRITRIFATSVRAGGVRGWSSSTRVVPSDDAESTIRPPEPIREAENRGGRGARARVHTVERPNIRSMRRGPSRPGVRVREATSHPRRGCSGRRAKTFEQEGTAPPRARRETDRVGTPPSGRRNCCSKRRISEVFRTAGKAFQYKASSHLTTARARSGRRRAARELDDVKRQARGRRTSRARFKDARRARLQPGVSSRARRVSSSRPVHGCARGDGDPTTR